MSYWAPFLLVGITAVLLVLPVTPALHELRMRRDAGPLSTSRHDGKITNIAESFRSRLEPLREELEGCRIKHEVARTRWDGLEVLLVGHNAFNFDPEQMRQIAAVMCGEAAFIPSKRVVTADLWSLGDLHVGEEAVLRAVLASGDVTLGENSAVLRWLHAGGTVYLRRGSSAHNRLSADQAVVLNPGCAFQRVHARIIFVAQDDRRGHEFAEGFARKENNTAGAAKLPDDNQWFAARPRMRIHGNCVLPAEETLRANVITTGEFRMERGASFFGSIKSYKNTVIEEGASVHGSIACGGTAFVGPESFLSGPLMAEDDVYLSSGSCLGRPDCLTTVAASRVRLSPGCRIHGTIWARLQGSVEG